MSDRNLLQTIVDAHKAGFNVGVFSICSSNEVVVETTVKFAKEYDMILSIEATCNQVNQFGGYTGMKPLDFVEMVLNYIEKYDFPENKLILGGDHLGPFPWINENAKDAMLKAEELVRDYVRAGFRKIHLDASMKCDDDNEGPLDLSISAERTARLCAVAEKVAKELQIENKLRFIIGTEVPVPGGVQGEGDALQVTVVDDVQRMIETTKQAFEKKDLRDAWGRVVGLVVQPGVEFSDLFIHRYDRNEAKELSAYIKNNSQFVFEAHSTDYQSGGALKALVEDHFAILKVGPELTFAYREALFSLEKIEQDLLEKKENVELSDLKNVVDKLMKEQNIYWKKYYLGDLKQQAIAREYSYSDRVRYYWTNENVQKAIQKLYKNLNKIEIHSPLISMYFSNIYTKYDQDDVVFTADKIVELKIFNILNKYHAACFE